MLDEVMDKKLEEKKVYPEVKHDAMYSEEYEGAVVMREYDEAFIGYATHFTPNGIKPVAVYDREKIIEILQEGFEKDKSDEEEDHDCYLEAVEYFDFNIAGAYAATDKGCMPIFVSRGEQAWLGFTD